MKALRCNQHGGPELLTVEDIAAPVPKAREVLVSVKAAGVNFPDALIIQNKYQFKPALPFTPGGELAGVVTAVGDGVTRVRVGLGDVVIGFTGWGAFAELAVLPAEGLIPMPKGMPFEIAGSFLMTYGTSWHALKDRAQLKAGETVLVLGAAGGIGIGIGIGIAAIEIFKALGGCVIAAASSTEKLQICRAMGADETINYSCEDLRERVKAMTGGRGVDVVCDPVGGKFTEPALRSLAWRSRLLVIGFADGEIPRLPLNLPLLKGCAIVGVFWGDFLKRQPDAAAADLGELSRLYAQSSIAPLVSLRCPLEGAGGAIEALMKRQVIGKAVVLP